MFRRIQYIASFVILTAFLQLKGFAVEGSIKMRRACLNKSDSTVTLLWFKPTDNCNTFTSFSIYGREDAMSVFKYLGGSTNFSLNSIQTKISNQKNWEFYLVYSKACNGTDSIYSDTLIIDDQQPVNSSIDSVSVELVSQKTIIGWSKSASNDVAGYIIYNYTGNTFVSFDNTKGTQSKDTDPNRDPSKKHYDYSIAAYDSCGNLSLISATHATMVLSNKYDECSRSIDLTWEAYTGWGANNIESYTVYMNLNNTGYVPIVTINGNVSRKFTYNFTHFGDTYCFYVRAKKTGQNITSSSNISCLGTFSIIEPSQSYIAKVSVDLEIVELTFVTQIGTSLTKINIYKAEDNNPFGLWQTVNFNGGTLTLIDNQVKVHNKNYSYYFTTEGNCANLIFDSSQICKTILLKINILAPGNQDLAWNNYSLFKKNTEKQELILTNTPIANKSSPWNILNTFNTNVTMANDQSIFSTSMQQLCYCIRAIENPINQFYRRQDTSYSNVECVTADPIVFFPNAIQINGFNTSFFPEGVFIDYKKSSFQIFNRWGQLLYETNDIRKGWDGKLIDGEYVEEDIYAYSAIIIGINGKQLNFDGTVTVLK